MKIYNPYQYVELFHLLFLSQLGRKIDKKLYTLKGGCNMRFYFQSIRYSEDMDIDIQTIHKDTLHKNVNQILNSSSFKHILQTYSLEMLNVSAPKQTLTTQRWKITLKSLTTMLPLHTKIEFSRRHFGRDIKFEVINSQILSQYSLNPIMINHYSLQSMYEQKIMALALRNETQARDIFDLYFLINIGKLILTSLERKTKQYLSQAKMNISRITFADFKGQVVAYLQEEDQEEYNNEMVWKHIVKTVTQSLEEKTT